MNLVIPKLSREGEFAKLASSALAYHSRACSFAARRCTRLSPRFLKQTSILSANSCEGEGTRMVYECGSCGVVWTRRRRLARLRKTVLLEAICPDCVTYGAWKRENFDNARPRVNSRSS